MRKPFQKRSFLQPRYGHPSILASTRLIREKRRLRLFKESFKLSPRPYAKVLMTITALIATGGLMYLLFFSSVFLVQDITLKTDNLLLDQEKQAILQELTDLKGKNLVLIDHQTWEERLLKSHPEFATVQLKKRFPKTVVIEITQYPLVANLFFKGRDADGHAIERKYIINAVGFISQADIENPAIPYIIMETDEKPLLLRAQALTPEKVRYLLSAASRFQKLFGMKVLDVLYKKVEREAHLRTERGFTVWIDMEQDLDHQLLKLKRVLPNLDIYHWRLAYIDLRIGGKEGEKIIFKRQ